MPSTFRLIPVIDIQYGKVVRGIGGRRAEYRPLVSRLTSQTEPIEVARCLIDLFHPSEIYVADLDAIAGRQASWPNLAVLDFGKDLWIDAGIRTECDIEPLKSAHAVSIVIGLETVTGPEVLDAAIAKVGPERIVFSLDLRDGQMLGSWQTWMASDECDWRAVVDRAVQSGVKHMILLDLSRVGEGRGTGTDEMCRTITSEHPEVEVVCGGGIAQISDLLRLKQCGASGALVASALHDGRIKPEDVARMEIKG